MSKLPVSRPYVLAFVVVRLWDNEPVCYGFEIPESHVVARWVPTRANDRRQYVTHDLVFVTRIFSGVHKAMVMSV